MLIKKVKEIRKRFKKLYEKNYEEFYENFYSLFTGNEIYNELKTCDFFSEILEFLILKNIQIKVGKKILL